MYGGPAFSEYKIEERESSLHGAVLIGGFSDVGPGEHSSVPHRHTFVELAWLSRGSGTHTIDASMFPVRPRTLHIITPGQVHAWQPGRSEERRVGKEGGARGGAKHGKETGNARGS